MGTRAQQTIIRKKCSLSPGNFRFGTTEHWHNRTLVTGHVEFELESPKDVPANLETEPSFVHQAGGRREHRYRQIINPGRIEAVTLQGAVITVKAEELRDSDSRKLLADAAAVDFLADLRGYATNGKDEDNVGDASTRTGTRDERANVAEPVCREPRFPMRFAKSGHRMLRRTRLTLRTVRA